MRKINLEVVIKIIVLLLISLYFLKIIVCGQLKYYVHPRMLPVIIISIIIMIISALLLIRHIYDDNKKIVSLRRYFIFIIPLIAVVLFENNNYIEASDNLNTASSYNSDTQVKSSDNKSVAEENNDDTDEPNIIPDNLNNSDSSVLTVRCSNFVKYLSDIIKEPDKYDGKEIDIDGFLYKNDSLSENQFVVAREMMVCCAADMQVVGLRCEISKDNILPKNTWIKVHGIMKKDKYEEKDDILIIVDSVEKDDSPDKSYVYPF